MELKPDGSLLVDNALTMSRLSSAELCPEVASLVRLTLGGDSGAFEQIIMRYETRVMGLATRLVRDFRLYRTRFPGHTFVLCRLA